MSEKKIVIKDVTKKYGEFAVVKNVSLEIIPGQKWGFLGHNGSGKTTLLRMMLGTLPPTHGEIFFEGHLVDNKMRKRIGFVPQTDALDTALTVYENLYFFGLYHGLSLKESSRRAAELIQSTNLQASPHQGVQELSGGNRKKVAILRSLMLRPDYLFMDEPANHLDFHSRLWLNNLSAKMTMEGKTLVLTSHDISEVEQTCDHLLIMSQGRVVASGNLNSLMKEHLRGSVIEYTLDSFQVEERDKELLQKFKGRVINEKCFLFLDQETVSEEVIPSIKSSAITLRKPTLKDLYIKLTDLEKV